MLKTITKICCTFVLMICFFGCGLKPAVKTADGFKETMQHTKKVGIVVSRFSLYSKGKFIDNAISKEISKAMEECLGDSASILPFETVMLPNDNDIASKLTPKLNELYKYSGFVVPDPRKAIGQNNLFGNMDDFFKRNEIDMLLVLSGNYSIEIKEANAVGSFIGALIAGIVTGDARSTHAGSVAGGGISSKPEILYGLTGIDRNGTPVFVAVRHESFKDTANMITYRNVQTAATVILEKVKEKL
jgi:hypothetical protein